MTSVFSMCVLSIGESVACCILFGDAYCCIRGNVVNQLQSLAWKFKRRDVAIHILKIAANTLSGSAMLYFYLPGLEKNPHFNSRPKEWPLFKDVINAVKTTLTIK